MDIVSNFYSPSFKPSFESAKDPRPAPAELNGILDIDVNGNRTRPAVRLIRYAIL